MFRAPCAHRQEVKIVLYSLWYHHTYRWPSDARDVTEVRNHVYQVAITVNTSEIIRYEKKGKILKIKKLLPTRLGGGIAQFVWLYVSIFFSSQLAMLKLCL